jgi:hypothetical protein
LPSSFGYGGRSPLLPGLRQLLVVVLLVAVDNPDFGGWSVGGA